MNKYEALSLGMSALALTISAATGYFQYQTRQDAVEERIKIELKMMLDKSPLSPLELRMISGVEERENLQSAVLVTNLGSTSVRILEAGYQDFDLPNHAFYAGAEEPRTLSPGEQAIFPISDIVKVNRQLVSDIRLGEEKISKIFAVSTKGNRFEAPAVIEVAK